MVMTVKEAVMITVKMVRDTLRKRGEEEKRRPSKNENEN